jgi:hypothetical protein
LRPASASGPPIQQPISGTTLAPGVPVTARAASTEEVSAVGTFIASTAPTPRSSASASTAAA